MTPAPGGAAALIAEVEAMHTWMFEWGWGWFWTVIGGLFTVAIIVVPLVFFLLNMRGLLERVSLPNRAMSPDLVWLNFIPIFNLFWFIYMVVKVRDSVRDEYRSRGWREDTDFAYNIGLTAGILAACSVVLGWVPFFGALLGIAWLVCWIVYWVRTNDLKNRLGARQDLPGTGRAPHYGTGAAYGPPTGRPPAGGAPTSPAGGPPASPAAAAPARSAQVKWCGACGTAILAGDRFCRACGMPLPQAAQTAPSETGTAAVTSQEAVVSESPEPSVPEDDGSQDSSV